METVIKAIAGFTIMYDDESGNTIRYVKDMSIEETGGMKDFYDKNSSSYNPKSRKYKLAIYRICDWKSVWMEPNITPRNN